MRALVFLLPNKILFAVCGWAGAQEREPRALLVFVGMLFIDFTGRLYFLLFEKFNLEDHAFLSLARILTFMYVHSS